jgi:hypothetical protein
MFFLPMVLKFSTIRVFKGFNGHPIEEDEVE